MSIDEQTKKLAAIAYGEASAANDRHEIGAIAWAVANRARAWGNKTLDQMLSADPNYTYAVKDGNQRFKRLMAASEKEIENDKGMALLLSAQVMHCPAKVKIHQMGRIGGMAWISRQTTETTQR